MHCGSTRRWYRGDVDNSWERERGNREALGHEVEVVELVLYVRMMSEGPRSKGLGERTAVLTLYFWTCRLILDVSTQVTKSSMLRVTRNAGSVMVSGPTRTWPCST